MKRIAWFFYVFSFCLPMARAQVNFITPEHTVVLILENHPYNFIVGSMAAPYINSLLYDSYSAVFINSFAIEHPSQPNYLDLYSGCNQGVTNNNTPLDSFITPNLGRQLVDSGKTFISYSDSLPYVGFNGDLYDNYARKHNPVANWMGTSTNQLSPSVNRPFTNFPVDFDSLPTVSFVIPNMTNDMHNGPFPAAISTSDTWIQNNLDGYIQWAKTHNSLFILTFDEDDYATGNHILTMFIGGNISAGFYPETINHYNVLRTIEALYGLPPICNAATVPPIYDIWVNNSGIPIELVNFTGHSEGTVNKLEWRTMSETNSDYFTLEQSKDAVHFVSIANIAAHGTSSSLINYSYTDNAPYPEINYYRLKHTDYDGKYDFSGIISIDNSNSSGQITISPNPFSSLATIKSTKFKITNIKTTDFVGTILKNEKVSGNSIVLDMSEFEKGIYFVLIEDENKNVVNKKIVVQ